MNQTNKKLSKTWKSLPKSTKKKNQKISRNQLEILKIPSKRLKQVPPLSKNSGSATGFIYTRLNEKSTKQTFNHVKDVTIFLSYFSNKKKKVFKLQVIKTFRKINPKLTPSTGIYVYGQSSPFLQSPQPIIPLPVFPSSYDHLQFEEHSSHLQAYI